MWLSQLKAAWGCVDAPLQAELAEQGIIGILSHEQQHTQAHTKAHLRRCTEVKCFQLRGRRDMCLRWCF